MDQGNRNGKGPRGPQGKGPQRDRGTRGGGQNSGGQHGGSGHARSGQGHRGGQHGGGQESRGTPQEIQAAYNFVPLADWVHRCPWADLLSQDWPFSDGLSGTIEFTVRNHTPLLVGAERVQGANAQQVKFFRLNGNTGAYAIPGTSLRGMIRNVLEIAAFGAFRQVDNRALGVRDLASAVKHDYQKRFADRGRDAEGVEGYKPLSRSAWLRFAEGRWWLEPCIHARVDYTKLDAWSGLTWNEDRKNGRFRPGALDKYRQIEQNGRSLEIFFKSAKEKAHQHSQDKRLIYRRVLEIASAGQDTPVPQGFNRGRLVLTGHPGRTKHMDFVFVAPRDGRERWREVPDEVMKRFLALNGGSDEWCKRWRGMAKRGEPVPVFFIGPMDRKSDAEVPIDAIGLSQMFKLPYRLDLHGAIRNSSAEHLEREAPDFVEAIFGYLDEAHGSLRSRVSFSVATASGEVRTAPPKRVVLGSPKPTYYPNYIVQKEEGGQLKGNYTTLMHPQARLRGWKRYPVKDGFMPTEASAEQQNVASILHPLAPGASFRGRLRVHNLRPVELGALLWALTWGGDGQLRHALGMGKPLGFGQVSIALGPCALAAADGAAVAEPQRLMRAFEAHMEDAARARGKPGWRSTPQMRELFAMADPARARGARLAHMRLEMNHNEFALVKGNLKRQEPALVLSSYTALKRR